MAYSPEVQKELDMTAHDMPDFLSNRSLSLGSGIAGYVKIHYGWGICYVSSYQGVSLPLEQTYEANRLKICDLILLLYTMEGVSLSLVMVVRTSQGDPL